MPPMSSHFAYMNDCVDFGTWTVRIVIGALVQIDRALIENM